MSESIFGLGSRPLRAHLNKSTTRINSRVIVYAGKPRSKGNDSKQKGKKPAWTPNANSKPKMQNLAGEEILLFDPIAPSKDALRVSTVPLHLKYQGIMANSKYPPPPRRSQLYI